MEGRTPILTPDSPVSDLFESRNQIRDDLSMSRRHIMAVMRDPAPEVATVSIGEVLCWCEGLTEFTVSRILSAASVNWGRRIDLVSEADQKVILFQIKRHAPEAWDRWRFRLGVKRAA